MLEQNNTFFDKLKDTTFSPKLPNHILIQKCENYCLVLDSSKPDWFFCSEDFLPLLKIIDGTRTIGQIRREGTQVLNIPLEIVDSLLKFLIDELYIIEISDFDPSIKFEGMLLDMVYIHLTSRCNQSCIYCYRLTNNCLDNELNYDEIKNLVYEIASISPGITIVLTGGEPLLHKDIVKICDFIKAQGFRIEINTNGQLIPKFPKLIGLVDVFNVSLDGSRQEIHEALRGPGTYLRTKKAISFLEENEAKFVIKPTFTSQNIADLPNLLSEYKNVHCSFKSNVFIKTGRGKYEDGFVISPKDLCNASEQFIRFGDASKVQTSQDFLPKKFIRKISCGMGVKCISIESNGDVYPCQLMHIDTLLMGNIRSSSLNKIYFHSSVSAFCRGLNVNNFNECKSCQIKYLCGGGCRARALFERGSLNSADGLCEFWRYVFPRSICYDAPEELFIDAK